MKTRTTNCIECRKQVFKEAETADTEHVPARQGRLRAVCRYLQRISEENQRGDDYALCEVRNIARVTSALPP